MYEEAQRNKAARAAIARAESDQAALRSAAWERGLARYVAEFIPTAREARLKRVWVGVRRMWIVGVHLVDAHYGHIVYGGDLGIAADGSRAWIHVSSSTHGLNTPHKYYRAAGPLGAPPSEFTTTEIDNQIRQSFVRAIERL